MLVVVLVVVLIGLVLAGLAGLGWLAVTGAGAVWGWVS